MIKSLTLPPALRKHTAQAAESLQRLRAAHQRLAPRERRLVTAAAVLGGGALLFLLAIEPAWKSMRALQAELPALRVQAATVADLASRARALQRGASAGPAALPADAEVEASLQQTGMAADQWAIERRDAGSLTLRFDAASAASALGWLDSAPRDWRLTLSELALVRPRDADDRRLPGRLSGTAVLSTQPKAKE